MLIPLNFPKTQAEVQVAQFVVGSITALAVGQHTALGTIAHAVPGAHTVTLVGQ